MTIRRHVTKDSQRFSLHHARLGVCPTYPFLPRNGVNSAFCTDGSCLRCQRPELKNRYAIGSRACAVDRSAIAPSVRARSSRSHSANYLVVVHRTLSTQRGRRRTSNVFGYTNGVGWVSKSTHPPSITIGICANSNKGKAARPTSLHGV